MNSVRLDIKAWRDGGCAVCGGGDRDDNRFSHTMCWDVVYYNGARAAERGLTGAPDFAASCTVYGDGRVKYEYAPAQTPEQRAEAFAREHKGKLAAGIRVYSVTTCRGMVYGSDEGLILFHGGDGSRWFCHIDTVRLVDDPAKSTEGGGGTMTSGNVTFKPMKSIPAYRAPEVASSPMPGSDLDELVLNHLNTLATYLRAEKKMFAINQEMARKVKDRIKARGGK